MKCPYTIKTHTQKIIDKNDLASEETGIAKGSVRFQQEAYEQQDCPQQECGAWHDGRCCYVTK